jgi:hypothetical protein
MNLQKAIVTALARAIPDAWERIVVNYEMQEEDGGLTEDRPGFYIAKDPTGPTSCSVPRSRRCFTR